MLKVAGRHGSRSMMQSARFAVVKEHRHRAGCCPVVFRWLMLTCNVVTFLVLVPYNGVRACVRAASWLLLAASAHPFAVLASPPPLPPLYRSVARHGRQSAHMGGWVCCVSPLMVSPVMSRSAVAGCVSLLQCRVRFMLPFASLHPPLSS